MKIIKKTSGEIEYMNIIIRDCLYDGRKPLFHYTSIESLYYILSTNSFKFNSLSNVDDLEEEQSKDLESFGRYCFVCCFTLNSEDNLAMWQMYSKGMTGVRLEFPCDFFDYSNARKYIEAKMTENNLCCAEAPSSPSIIGVKMEYTDDENILFPNIWTPEINNKFPLILNKLGKNKRKIWEFEKEVRYVVYTYPKDWYQEGDSLEIAKDRILNHKNTLSNLFIPIKKEKMKELKIIIGPKATEFDCKCVELIAGKYGILSNNISKSNLKIR